VVFIDLLFGREIISFKIQILEHQVLHREPANEIQGLLVMPDLQDGQQYLEVNADGIMEMIPVKVGKRSKRSFPNMNPDEAYLS
jgi:hypothetical protein